MGKDQEIIQEYFTKYYPKKNKFIYNEFEIFSAAIGVGIIFVFFAILAALFSGSEISNESVTRTIDDPEKYNSLIKGTEDLKREIEQNKELDSKTKKELKEGLEEISSDSKELKEKNKENELKLEDFITSLENNLKDIKDPEQKKKIEDLIRTLQNSEVPSDIINLLKKIKEVIEKSDIKNRKNIINKIDDILKSFGESLGLMSRIGKGIKSFGGILGGLLTSPIKAIKPIYNSFVQVFGEFYNPSLNKVSEDINKQLSEKKGDLFLKLKQESSGFFDRFYSDPGSEAGVDWKLFRNSFKPKPAMSEITVDPKKPKPIIGDVVGESVDTDQKGDIKFFIKGTASDTEDAEFIYYADLKILIILFKTINFYILKNVDYNRLEKIIKTSSFNSKDRNLKIYEAERNPANDLISGNYIPVNVKKIDSDNTDEQEITVIFDPTESNINGFIRCYEKGDEFSDESEEGLSEHVRISDEDLAGIYNSNFLYYPAGSNLKIKSDTKLYQLKDEDFNIEYQNFIKNLKKDFKFTVEYLDDDNIEKLRELSKELEKSNKQELIIRFLTERDPFDQDKFNKFLQYLYDKYEEIKKIINEDDLNEINSRLDSDQKKKLQIGIESIKKSSTEEEDEFLKKIKETLDNLNEIFTQNPDGLKDAIKFLFEEDRTLVISAIRTRENKDKYSEDFITALNEKLAEIIDDKNSQAIKDFISMDGFRKKIDFIKSNFEVYKEIQNIFNKYIKDNEIDDKNKKQVEDIFNFFSDSRENYLEYLSDLIIGIEKNPKDDLLALQYYMMREAALRVMVGNELPYLMPKKEDFEFMLNNLSDIRKLFEINDDTLDILKKYFEFRLKNQEELFSDREKTSMDTFSKTSTEISEDTPENYGSDIEKLLNDYINNLGSDSKDYISDSELNIEKLMGDVIISQEKLIDIFLNSKDLNKIKEILKINSESSEVLEPSTSSESKPEKPVEDKPSTSPNEFKIPTNDVRYVIGPLAINRNKYIDDKNHPNAIFVTWKEGDKNYVVSNSDNQGTFAKITKDWNNIADTSSNYFDPNVFPGGEGLSKVKTIKPAILDNDGILIEKGELHFENLKNKSNKKLDNVLNEIFYNDINKKKNSKIKYYFESSSIDMNDPITINNKSGTTIVYKFPKKIKISDIYNFNPSNVYLISLKDNKIEKIKNLKEFKIDDYDNCIIAYERLKKKGIHVGQLIIDFDNIDENSSTFENLYYFFNFQKGIFTEAEEDQKISISKAKKFYSAQPVKIKIEDSFSGEIKYSVDKNDKGEISSKKIKEVKERNTEKFERIKNKNNEISKTTSEIGKPTEEISTPEVPIETLESPLIEGDLIIKLDPEALFIENIIKEKENDSLKIIKSNNKYYLNFDLNPFIVKKINNSENFKEMLNTEFNQDVIVEAEGNEGDSVQKFKPFKGSFEIKEYQKTDKGYKFVISPNVFKKIIDGIKNSFEAEKKSKTVEKEKPDEIFTTGQYYLSVEDLMNNKEDLYQSGPTGSDLGIIFRNKKDSSAFIGTLWIRDINAIISFDILKKLMKFFNISIYDYILNEAFNITEFSKKFISDDNLQVEIINDKITKIIKKGNLKREYSNTLSAGLKKEISGKIGLEKTDPKYNETKKRVYKDLGLEKYYKEPIEKDEGEEATPSAPTAEVSESDLTGIIYSFKGKKIGVLLPKKIAEINKIKAKPDKYDIFYYIKVGDEYYYLNLNNDISNFIRIILTSNRFIYKKNLSVNLDDSLKEILKNDFNFLKKIYPSDPQKKIKLNNFIFGKISKVETNPEGLVQFTFPTNEVEKPNLSSSPSASENTNKEAVTSSYIGRNDFDSIIINEVFKNWKR